jgi:hypothetical protein
LRRWSNSRRERRFFFLSMLIFIIKLFLSYPGLLGHEYPPCGSVFSARLLESVLRKAPTNQVASTSFVFHSIVCTIGPTQVSEVRGAEEPSLTETVYSMGLSFRSLRKPTMSLATLSCLTLEQYRVYCER